MISQPSSMSAAAWAVGVTPFQPAPQKQWVGHRGEPQHITMRWHEDKCPPLPGPAAWPGAGKISQPGKSETAGSEVGALPRADSAASLLHKLEKAKKPWLSWTQDRGRSSRMGGSG